MRHGWDVLLQGEHSARGRMQLSDGSRVQGVMRVRQGRGVGFSCEVFCEDPLSSDQILEDALQERRRAREVQGALRSVKHLPPQIAVGG